MLLSEKVAVIYGAGGRIGGAIAEAFAREGARVFAPAHDEVDALDEEAVNGYVARMVGEAGRLDVSCNVIGLGDVQRPLTDLAVDEFLRPIVTAMRTQFLTTRAAAPHMVAQGSGVVLTFGGDGPQTLPGLGGFKVALDAMEGLRRQWAIELGRSGVRVVTLKTGGIPESLPEAFPGRDEIIAGLTDAAGLPYTATLADVGTVAAWVASDQARTITNADVNISCGAIVD